MNLSPVRTYVLNVSAFLVIYTEQIFKSILLKLQAVHFLTNVQNNKEGKEIYPISSVKIYLASKIYPKILSPKQKEKISM